MTNLIRKISPELLNSSSKICPVISINENYLAFVIDFVNIDFVAYDKKDKNV